MNKNSITIFGNRNEIEGEAIRQLERATGLPGMIAAAGLPDIQPGKGCPVGAAFLSDSIIYPYLLGNDVGCGMALWKTEMKSGRIKQEKIARKLYGLEESWDGDSAAWLKSFGVDRPSHEFALGTIGLGNHFMEIQTVDEIIDDNVCRTAGIDKEWLYLLIHSGSRTKGEALLRGHVDKHRDAGLDANSEDGGLYLEAHDECLRWAHANRSLIARRVFDLLDVDGGEICDLPHNFVEESESGGVKGFIHRKGATSSDRGITVVPGSRGSLTYIVQPVPNGASINSIAHGAGRKWARSDCMDRLKGRFTKESLARTELGGMVICEDKDLLFEEAPMAYKKIEKVISIMQDSGLIKVIATMKPVITYKVRR